MVLRDMVTLVIVMIMLLWQITSSVPAPEEVKDGNEVADNFTINTDPPENQQNETSTQEGTFWQITDIHWDQQYSEYGDASKMCHKSYIARGHNGVYGSYLCDSPWALVKNAIETMVEINNKPDFILWTGDNVPHTDDPEPDFTVIFNTISNITGELRTSFQELIPILPVLGNHDAFPKDDYPVAGEEFYGQYLTKGGWSSVLPEEAQDEFKKGGYYGYELPTGVTVLVVNTNLYYAFNILGVNASDPCGQFAWLRKRLQKAQDTNSKVILAAHAPPGYFERFAEIPFFNATYNDAYVDLLNEFGMVIMAQIYGHEHTDSFRLFQSSKGIMQSVAFLAPSVTPWYPSTVPGGTAINPSLRLYSYNNKTLLDYTQFHLNLTEANSPSLGKELSNKGTTVMNNTVVKDTELMKPKWEIYYQARKAYGLKNLDVTNMENLYTQLISDEDLFQKYYVRNSAGYTDDLCSSECRRNQLCAIKNVKIKDLEKCMGYNHYNGNLHSPSSNSSPLVIAIMASCMSLTTILAVTLAIMLVVISFRRNQILRTEKSLPVVDLTWGRQHKHYRQLP